ncbi:hypothetical protein AB0L82_36885 [Nocardia sp. NPDC052001]|uniref:hypothetical protein n=1 Tax=Nocardia sp. NPDC052001 TaxID=3154853 RepID=UPI003412BF17
MEVPVIAGAVASAVFASSTLPMLAKARRTKDVRSYSPANIALANIGNLVYMVYVLDLPPGPIWALHLFHTISSGLMLVWYLRYVVFASTPDESNSGENPAVPLGLTNAIGQTGSDHLRLRGS